jgi:long-chain acyl-CoA synthetase
MPTWRNDALLAGSQVSRFLVLHKELDADDGELTRTQQGSPWLHRRERYELPWWTPCTAGRTEQYIETHREV